jgi:hypothetical protein
MGVSAWLESVGWSLRLTSLWLSLPQPLALSFPSRLAFRLTRSKWLRRRRGSLADRADPRGVPQSAVRHRNDLGAIMIGKVAAPGDLVKAASQRVACVAQSPLRCSARWAEGPSFRVGGAAEPTPDFDDFTRYDLFLPDLLCWRIDRWRNRGRGRSLNLIREVWRSCNAGLLGTSWALGLFPEQTDFDFGQRTVA